MLNRIGVCVEIYRMKAAAFHHIPSSALSASGSLGIISACFNSKHPLVFACKGNNKKDKKHMEEK